MKVINDLLKIKAHREQQAETALSQASRALRDAEKAVASAEERLQRAHAEYDAKKNDLYKDLFSRVVQRADLDLARFKLEKIDESFKQCETELHQKKENLALAESERERKRAEFKDASRIREKYTELSVEIRARLAEAITKKEELEMDEVVTRHGDGRADSPVVHFERAV